LAITSPKITTDVSRPSAYSILKTSVTLSIALARSASSMSNRASARDSNSASTVASVQAARAASPVRA